MATKKKDSNKEKPPKTSTGTPSLDPEVEKLIKGAMATVNGGLEGVEIYTESFFREWIPTQRDMWSTSYDYIADYGHLEKLSIWKQAEMFGVLFGVRWKGFMWVSKMILNGVTIKPVKFKEHIAFRQNPTTKRWGPKYESSPEIKEWYVPANYARIKFEDILSRNISKIPGLYWNESEKVYFFNIEKFLPWLIDFDIIKWLKDQRCRVPDGLEAFLESWKDRNTRELSQGQKLSPSELAKAQRQKNEMKKLKQENKELKARVSELEKSKKETNKRFTENRELVLMKALTVISWESDNPQELFRGGNLNAEKLTRIIESNREKLKLEDDKTFSHEMIKKTILKSIKYQ